MFNIIGFVNNLCRLFFLETGKRAGTPLSFFYKELLIDVQKHFI